MTANNYLFGRPKVSVIVPNYNHSDYLVRRIDSILHQTFQDFEIIILDDASNDSSVEILRSYAIHPKVSHFLANSENTGNPFKQWSKGVSVAAGEFVWIAESDDWAEPDFLANLVPLLEEDEAVEAVFCRSRKVDREDQDLGLWEDHFTKSLEDVSAHVLLTSMRLIEVMLEGNCIPNTSAVLTRRRAFSLLTPDISTWSLNGDWIFWIKVIESGSIQYCPDPLNHFRNHASNVRSRVEATGENLLEYLKVVAFLKGLRPSDKTILRKASSIVTDLHFRRARGFVDEGVYASALREAARLGVRGMGYRATIFRQRLRGLFHEHFR